MVKKHKKDNDYYRKLYRKLRAEKFEPVRQLKMAIGWYQMIIITLLKINFKGNLIVTRESIEGIDPTEELIEDFDKDKNIVLKVVKMKPKKK